MSWLFKSIESVNREPACKNKNAYKEIILTHDATCFGVEKHESEVQNDMIHPCSFKSTKAKAHSPQTV